MLSSSKKYIIAITVILLLIFPYSFSYTIAKGQAVNAYPMGVTAFSLSNKIVTTYVQGDINISGLKIGSSYLPNGQYFTTGNASLQLNAVLDANYWEQNVALFHQINSTTFLITFVINIWNFSGNFVNYSSNNSIVTNYNGFGVVLYTGPTIIVSLPLHLALFIESNKTSSMFGYIVNGKKEIYYVAPIGGDFIIGGLSTALLPNDLELVWGGPGGGSVVYMSVNATAELYYLSGGSLKIFPEVLSVGLDTAEAAIGVHVSRSVYPLFDPYGIEYPGNDNLGVLWPTPPSISYTLKNETLYINVSLNGVPLANQRIYVEVLKGFNLTPIANITTSINGSAVVPNLSTSYFIIYYPGNYTLSSTYVISIPSLQHFISKIKTEYEALVSYLSSYNFKKALASFFSNAKYTNTVTSQTQVNITIIEYVLAFVLGILFAAFIIREKT